MYSCNELSKLTRRMNAQVDVQIAADDDSVPGSDDIAVWVSRAIQVAGHRDEAEVSVRVVDAIEMQELNSEFRDQNKPTNVLSFPAGAIEGLPVDEELPLGDIVVCAEVVRTEAEEQGKAVADHWAHMMVHGTLHLLGFDHENDRDAAAMEGLEIQVLSDHGIKNPYRDSFGESPQET
jgi:probable rRNA maturation factor